MTGSNWTDDDRTVDFDDEVLPEPVRDDTADRGDHERLLDERLLDERLLDERPPHWD